MFKWFKRIQRRTWPKVFCSYYVIIPGEHQVGILGIIGVSLHEVTRPQFMSHKGLKYWIESVEFKDLKAEEKLKDISLVAREDIINLIFNKPLRKFDTRG